MMDRSLFITPETTIREVIEQLNRNRQGIVLIVDDDGRLVGTITDGDIRRAILDNEPQDQQAGRLLARKVDSRYAKPVTARAGSERQELLALMRKHVIRHVPLLDDDGRVVELATLESLLPNGWSPPKAVVMAGGFGKRLRPLTDNLPKPMLPVGGKPMLERTIDQLRQAGIRHVNISTHFQPEKIRDYFGNGERFGVDIEYVSEDRPLGTAGALGLMEAGDEPLLVINGDILTSVDFKAMHRYHREHQADLTVGVRQYDFIVPYGLVECDGPEVKKISEKPRFAFFVNAGIYLLEPGVRRFIPAGRHFDMTDLMTVLIENGRNVVSFPIMEYWLDVGRPADYEQAQEDLRDGKL